MEPSVPAQAQLQNAASAGAYDGMNITESSDAVVSKTSEYYTTMEARVGEQDILVEPESLQIAGSGNGDVLAMHEEISLERFNGLDHMDVDESKDASHGTGFHGFGENHVSENIDQAEEIPEVAEFGGKTANSDVPQVQVESNVAKPQFDQHLTLSDDQHLTLSGDQHLTLSDDQHLTLSGDQHPPLSGNVESLPSPEPLQGQVVKADQNGTSPAGEQQPPKTPVAASDSISNDAGVTEARDTSSIPGISMLAGKSIPPAVFKQEEVIASKEVFTEALNKFHTVLGTRLTKKGRGGRERAAEVKTFEESIAGIPKLGGNDLDLHLLYKEVTSRGGLEQVIKDRKWKEVTNCFQFAETTTSASYLLRKYYVGLLYYFEQAYLHGKTGPLVPPPISMPGPSPMSVKRSDSGLGIAQTPTEGQPGFKRTRKRKLLPMQTMPVMDPSQQIGLTVHSTIEGKFEHGYLVSVTVGTEKMRGVLYHVPPMQRAPQHATIPNYETTVGAEPIIIREEPNLRGMKRKRRRADDMPKKDPNAPRPNRTGYNFFFAEQRAKLKALHPEKDKELSRMIGDAWNSLTEEEKAPYQDRGVQDKERYKTELRDYLERLKSQNGKTPKELAVGQATEAAKEVTKVNAKEAVVDAAIDVAVDVAVNNAVDVSVDDVVDVATKALPPAAAATCDAAAADNTTGKPAVTDANAASVSAAIDAPNGSYNPITAVDVHNGAPANTATVAIEPQQPEISQQTL